MIGAKLIGLGALLLALAGFLAWVFDRGIQHEKAAVNAATVAQVKEDAAISARRVQNLSEIAHDATVQADAARVAAAAAGHARDALRVRLNAFVAHARAADPPASGASYPADDPIGLLATLLGRVDEAAGRYSAEADANWIGWNACFKSYGALKR